MAKKGKGVFGAMGNLFRWTIYGLAAVLLFAIYLGWTAEESDQIASAPDIVLEQPAPEPEVLSEAEPEVTEAPATEAEQAAESLSDQASAAAEQVQAEAGALAAEAEAAAADVASQAEAAAAEVASEAQAALQEAETAANDIRSDVEEGLQGLADRLAGQDAPDSAAAAATPTAEEVEDAARPGDTPELSDAVPAEAAVEEVETPIELPSDITTFTVPGDDATYSLQNAFKRDDGAIEFTTERTGPDGITQTVTRLITCAPFAVGIISEGDGARIDQPDMERLALGTPEASVAALACGVFK